MSRKNVYKLPVVEESFVLESKSATSQEEEQKKKREEEIQKSYQNGWNDALAKNRKDVELICQSLNKAIDDLRQERDGIWSKCENEIIKLTFAISKKTVYEEISQGNSRIIERVVNDSINRIKEKKILKVHVNPDDAESMRAMKISGFPNEGEAYEIVIDDKMSRGGCRVITDCGGVDASIETRWNEIVSAFEELNLETEGMKCQQ